MYYEKLLDNLFVDIDYPEHLTKLIGNAQPWRAFCALPEEVKKHYEFMSHQEDADPGYRLRKRSEGREDKEYFHIYPNMPQMISADGLDTEVAGNEALKTFFDYSVRVQEAANTFALEIGRELGKEIPELAKLVETGKIRSVLRLLHYTDTEDIIAAQHFDRSLYTLHLYESGPGLEFLDWNMRWKSAPIGQGKTVVFSGYRGEAISDGKLQKTWHRVVRRDDAPDRYSMVLFVWTDAISQYDRNARSQDMTPSYSKN